MGDSLTTVDPMTAWEALRSKATAMVKSGFLPKAINTPEKAIAIIQAGQELGLGPMQAVRSIHVIDAKPTLSAELMAGLVYQRVPGGTLRVAESTSERCVVFAGRPGHEPTRFAFTLEDAKRAGIGQKDVWHKYPRAMLRSRCVSEACRAVFPDATMGCYTPEEMGAVVDEAGTPLPEVRPATLDVEGEPVPQGDEVAVLPAATNGGDKAPRVGTLRLPNWTWLKPDAGKPIDQASMHTLEKLIDSLKRPKSLEDPKWGEKNRLLLNAAHDEIDRRVPPLAADTASGDEPPPPTDNDWTKP